ncbi:hypothetical protein [Aestuariibacter sp. A3R04]|uniref:hypothetical protein n=1 Tax=Aestuariibacter sp. A3R04 TaxID=2841571 RepID=UPI001C084D56|nr:hypothetical protein [Aestuariibacter sp. A3R04]MBU3023789.1 hypothetical protein [Aestuariibacter sp. A3R04]
MSLMQDYSSLLTGIAEQYEDWSVTDNSPLTISRQSEHNMLPLSISVYGGNTKAHLFFNLYDDGPFTALAQKVLQTQEEEKIQQEDEDSGLVIIIDSDGFAVVYDATEVSPEEFATQFDSITKTADHLLMQIVGDAHESTKDLSDTPSDKPSATYPATQQRAMGIDDVVKQYFTELNYKHKHDEANKRFIFGFNTDSYTNRNNAQSLQIVIDYSDDDLLRFETPWLYEFDLEKTKYNLVASAVAWFQFEYKFLSMSLDPADGELKISIDIPRGKGVIHTSQIKRIVSFILQFSESSYDELFKTLLTDSAEAQSKLNALIEKHKNKVANRDWRKSIEDKLDSLTDEQKKAIEAILAQNEEDSGSGKGGI